MIKPITQEKDSQMFELRMQPQNGLKDLISQNYYKNEQQAVQDMLDYLGEDYADEAKIKALATKLIASVRENRIKGNGVDALMQEFKLSSAEGVALMCLAESLLRIPDGYTRDKLISDKIVKGDWESHKDNKSFFVKSAVWGLTITGKLLQVDGDSLAASLRKVVAKFGAPIIRQAMGVAVRTMGNQFVMGETIDSALQAAVAKEAKGYQFSYDMLGEGALTEDDATKYMQSYIDAITTVGTANAGRGVKNGPGISVKLSAIHPRYQRMKRDRVQTELLSRLITLYQLAQKYSIALFIDAEETERLEISLDLLEGVLNEPTLANFDGIGFVIQSYQRRSSYVIDYVADLAKRYNNKVMVRLVKGAYWDSEVKKAQAEGVEDYPVFTRKFYTDLSYLACAKRLFAHSNYIYPLYATHNAYSLAAVYEMSNGKPFEFQCLYGMGETLYDNVVGKNNLNVTCRVYAPVGTYETLLAYLVRRLLENGANSSFVHQLVDPNIAIEELVVSPVELVKKAHLESNPYFNKPANIYPDGRINSRGINLNDEALLAKLDVALEQKSKQQYTAKPLLAKSSDVEYVFHPVLNPANLQDIVGQAAFATPSCVEVAIRNAQDGFISWSSLDPKERAEKILKFADLLEENYFEVLSIVVREAGKTLSNAVAEIREAVDFCRYYAKQVQNEFNNATHEALGVTVCISPWNFPLAIFVGEVVSSLVAGNVVIAKPSEQTNLIASYAVELLHKAGVPVDAIQLLCGEGAVVGNLLTADERVKAVIFTGSTEVAQIINRNFAKKSNQGVLIAETGGQNTMIVDSTALPEQVVVDVLSSAFDSAGQRCSALRVLYLQSDIADKVIHMLKGAMDELYVGNPARLKTDVGPVIDREAQQSLLNHIETMKKQARSYHQTKLSSDCAGGIFVAPTMFEIGGISELKREVFGPVVHIIRFDGNQLDAVIDEINTSGYGLTQGLHSRLEDTAIKVHTKIRAGNIYINRNTVGAVVGVQPFGGEGLSGTGPKAGGPLYLYRLVNTRVHPTLNAVGGTDLSKLSTITSENLAGLGVALDNIHNLTLLKDKLSTESLLGTRIDLPGPTGEENYLKFAARGKVLCIANSIDGYIKQIIYALATGNKIIMLKNSTTQKLNSLTNIEYVDKLSDVGLVHAVMLSYDCQDSVELRREIASRDGLLVHVLIETSAGYDEHLLLTERTVSINSTATGGNVQLMSINDIV